VPPKYSDAFWKSHADGFVSVLVWIETDGSVTFQRVWRSSGADYERPVIEAVKQWRYAPVICDGRAMRVELTIDFKVTHDEAAP